MKICLVILSLKQAVALYPQASITMYHIIFISLTNHWSNKITLRTLYLCNTFLHNALLCKCISVDF